MGKKHRLKQKEKSSKSNLQPQHKKQILRQVEDIFTTCVKNVNPQEEWDYYVKLHSAVEELRLKQNADISGQHFEKEVDRASLIPEFLKWLQLFGASWHGIDIKDYGNKDGLGIIACDDLKTEELLVSIPRAAMITHQDILSESYLKELIEHNEILSQMPNVCLALYIHCESCNPNSKFQPYLDILPTTFNTTLYFTPDEMRYLKGSSILSTAINHYKSIVRQFCLIYKIFNGTESRASYVEKMSSCAKDKFTFDAYRWAVSAVSTRQNQIPKRGCGEVQYNDPTTLAMIPLWDLFNHQPGPMSTVYDIGHDHLECYSMSNFKPDDQVKICYGARNNADLLIHNGFALPDNPHGREVTVSLGVSHQDPLRDLKKQLLNRLSCDGNYIVTCNSKHSPVSPRLATFLRVFHMDKDHLESWLARSNDELLAVANTKLFAHAQFVDDARACKFLEDRLSLLLKMREKTREALPGDELSSRANLALLVCKNEEAVMRSSIERCRHLRESHSTTVRENVEEGDENEEKIED